MARVAETDAPKRPARSDDDFDVDFSGQRSRADPSWYYFFSSRGRSGEIKYYAGDKSILQ